MNKKKSSKPLSLGSQHFLLGKKGLKAQFGIMEYILLSVFLIAILLIGIFLLSGFEQVKSRGETTKEFTTKQLLSMNIITHSSLFAKEEYLDDTKLETLAETESCSDLQKLTGQQACIEVEALLPSAREERECGLGTYPNCNKWILCKDVCASKGGFRILTLPVNIHRKIQDRVDLGVLTYKVPS